MTLGQEGGVSAGSTQTCKMQTKHYVNGRHSFSFFMTRFLALPEITSGPMTPEAAGGGFWLFSATASARGPKKGLGVAGDARSPETKRPHVPPARARARLEGLASPPLPPGRPRLPLPSPHTLAQAPWPPHAHVLNLRRPSCRLQLSPGLPVSFWAGTSFIERGNSVSLPFTTLTFPNMCPRC